MFRTPRPRTYIAALAAALALTAAAPAQESGEATAIRGARFVRLVEMLGADDYATREEAMRELIDGAVDLGELEQRLNDASLTLEQRYRLLAVARRRLLSRPKGALGISMDWQREGLGAGAVVVTDLLPELPAMHVLQLDDRITHVDGQALRSSNHLLRYVQDKLPGQRVVLTVRRPRFDDNGEVVLDESARPIHDTLELPLELGSADLLIDARTGLPQVSTVDADRRHQADELDDLYAPQPRTITLRGPGREDLIGAATDSTRPGFIAAHPELLRLQEELFTLRAEDRGPTDRERDGWHRRLDELLEQIQAAVDPLDRARLQIVADRYAQMIEPFE